MKRKFRAGLIILAAIVVLFSGCTIVVTSKEARTSRLPISQAAPLRANR